MSLDGCQIKQAGLALIYDIGDPYDLHRFVEAQDPVYEQVCSELEQGFKMSHWMWFIFPQLEGLSLSATSKKFAISCLDEAVAYLNHPVLSTRLLDCTDLVTSVSGRTIQRILGPIDSMKFQSSMTLFTHATTENELFEDALLKYYSGQYDPLTLNKL